MEVNNTAATVICRRLNCDGQIIEKFMMQRKTAREIVRKKQGQWVNKDVVFLFYKDGSGCYHPPTVQKECKNQRYVAPLIIKAVQYCIAEQERERINKHNVTLLCISIPGQLRRQIRNTVLAQPSDEITIKGAILRIIITDKEQNRIV